jgi:hypothetical protein
LAQKKGPVRCEDQPLKAIRSVELKYKPVANKSQTEFQASYLSRRFRLNAVRAALTAELVFGGSAVHS